MKVWLLFHLHEAGIKGVNLFRLYCVYIRSRIEYLSAAYHSILLAGQAEALERLHRYAVRVCFGFGGNYPGSLNFRCPCTTRSLTHVRSAVCFLFFCYSCDFKWVRHVYTTGGNSVCSISKPADGTSDDEDTTFCAFPVLALDD